MISKAKVNKLGKAMEKNFEKGFKLNRIWFEKDTYYFQYYNLDNLFKINKSTLELIKVHETEIIGKYEFYVEQIQVPKEFKSWVKDAIKKAQEE